MPLNYENLDAATRSYMKKEFEADRRAQSIYRGKRLTDRGWQEYPGLLEAAITRENDDFLAHALLDGDLLKSTEEYVRNGKAFERKVNQPAAAGTLGEGEFNRYYMRGLCLRAIESGTTELEIYRAKEVQNARPESVAKIGTRIDPRVLLADLRANRDATPDEGVPGGPNSGLSVRILRQVPVR